MIAKITKSKVHQVCGHCGMERVVPIDDLIAGQEFDPNTIRLPECSMCGSVETLNRTWDHVPSDMHRRRVNRLHAMLIAAGRGHANHAARFAEEATSSRVPPDMDPEPVDEVEVETNK